MQNQIREIPLPNARRPSVLVVDDDPIAREIAMEALVSAGYPCRCAEDGEFGIAAMEARPADLVLLDVVMPNKEGIETLREIKQRWPSTIVIMMSAGTRVMPSQGLLGIASSLGADATMPKPVRPGPLLALVEAVTGVHRTLS